jgi:hypothetical protein
MISQSDASIPSIMKHIDIALCQVYLDPKILDTKKIDKRVECFKLETLR